MKSLLIENIVRSGAGIADEEIHFRKGLNVLVGRPNTGKTKWLQMLDYAFGSEKAPKEVFGDDLSDKYDRVQVTLQVNGKSMQLERRWKESGNKQKVFLDGNGLPARDFCAELLSRLGIPLIHYPQGDPYGKRAWPELNWRSLLRHIYRRQHFWSDLADNQPTSEQHACLLQFTGVAEHLFSPEFGELVAQEKRIAELQMKREEFLNMLHEVSRELLDDDDLGVALTPESISGAIQKVKAEILNIHDESESVLKRLRQEAESLSPAASKNSIFDEQSERLAELRAKSESVQRARTDIQERIKEIDGYREGVEQEMGRVKRAQAAGVAFANLKVTHCPACDQQVTISNQTQEFCYVCHQSTPPTTENGANRIKFELDHLESEAEEASELLLTLRADLASHLLLEKNIALELRKSEGLLRPLQRIAASILPPEVGALNIRLGQFQERQQQLERIEAAFDKREKLTLKIEDIERSVAELQTKVATRQSLAHLDRAAQWIGDGINNYLTAMSARQPGAWPQDKVRVRLLQRDFDVSVGGGRWSAKLGGTLTLYFLIAYQFGLMTLSPRQECHYPGLVILDLPPELEDGSSVKDKENFILEPFAELLALPEFGSAQVIAAGSSFENLEGANRIQLTHVWTGKTTT